MAAKLFALLAALLCVAAVCLAAEQEADKIKSELNEALRNTERELNHFRRARIELDVELVNNLEALKRAMIPVLSEGAKIPSAVRGQTSIFGNYMVPT